MEGGPGTTVFVSGAAQVADGVAVADPGEVVLLVRSRTAVPSLRLVAAGEGLLRVPGLAPVALRGRAVELHVPMVTLRRLTGRRGVEETLSRQTIGVEPLRAGGIRLRAP
jgi:hypothetical protein